VLRWLVDCDCMRARTLMLIIKLIMKGYNMYACMYVCMHVCMYACMYACMHVCMYACMYVCMYVCMYACMYACMHVCMHACMYVCMYVCIYACMYVCMYVCMYRWQLYGTPGLCLTKSGVSSDQDFLSVRCQFVVSTDTIFIKRYPLDFKTNYGFVRKNHFRHSKLVKKSPRHKNYFT